MIPTKQSDQSGPYEIIVAGPFSLNWPTWLADLAVTATTSRSERETRLAGHLDQPALRALLCRLWDLNLTIVHVRRLHEDAPSSTRLEESNV